MKKILLPAFFFLLLIVIVVLFGLGWLFQNTSAPSSKAETRSLVIPKGSSGNQIANNLYKEGLIKNPLAFRLYVRFIGISGRIQEGEYDLSTNYSLPTLVKKLMEGPTEVWVTIPEGLRREEVAMKFITNFGLSSTGATDFYQNFLKITSGKEGYLFPDTYLLPKNSTPVLIDKLMETNFDKKYTVAQTVQTTKLAKREVVILASIIQREAITEDDMRGVASVLENRLSIGMALGSDVTLEYALGYQKDTKTWWKEGLTVDDLALRSPYNTRLVSGLPPTPIASPGVIALKAALAPSQTNYLYYLSDSNGKLHFAKTLGEHNANIRTYLGK